MIIESGKADEMQVTLDEAFARLPKAYRTEQVRDDIARVVVSDPDNHRHTAMQFVLEVIFTIDCAMDRLAGLKSR
jgi:hypothetical protein